MRFEKTSSINHLCLKKNFYGIKKLFSVKSSFDNTILKPEQSSLKSYNKTD